MLIIKIQNDGTGTPEFGNSPYPIFDGNHIKNR